MRDAAAPELGGGLPQLDMALDETLRLYPPAWIGPRRSVEPFEFAGHHVPGGVPVNYCSWASHRLPDVWDEPERSGPSASRPRRTRASCPRAPTSRSAAARAPASACASARPRSRSIAALILQRFRLELAARLRARDPPDADDRPARRAADGGARRAGGVGSAAP